MTTTDNDKTSPLHQTTPTPHRTSSYHNAASQNNNRWNNNRISIVDDGTPAAEALKAVQSVSVTRFDKFARKVKGPAVKKFVKRAATLKGPRHTKRGKPPRALPHWNEQLEGGIDDDDSDEYDIIEEVEEEGCLSSLEEDTGGEEIEMADRATGGAGNGVGKEGEKDEFKVDPVETTDKLNSSFHFRERRWKRRGSSAADSSKARKSYVKGKVIDGEHELYALTLAMMLGLRTSIGMTNGQLSEPNGGHKWLNTEDFMAVEKYSFRPKGGDKTPPHDLSHTFKFKDYSPKAFAYIRRLFGINEYDFLSSVCGNANFIEFISNAKSGQFFFYSSDGKFMIKTMTNAESKFLRRILPHYFKHCVRNPNTLISKYFGMYRVKMYYLKRNVKFIIMNSVWYTDKHIHRTYDLKGSVTGRESGPNETQKDNNVRAVLPQQAFFLPTLTRERLREQLVQDTKFLESMQILDYSMLIGVHHIRQRSAPVKKDKGSKKYARGRGSMGYLDVNVNRVRSNPTRPSALEEPKRRVRASSMPEGKNAALLYDSLTYGSMGSLSINPEAYLDDEDSSFLEGARNDDGQPEEFDRDKEYATEQMYWPFQRHYDIQGKRRLTPSPLFRQIDDNPHHTSHSQNQCITCDDYNSNSENLIAKDVRWDLPPFVSPITNRKDAGFQMDTSQTQVPIEVTGSNGMTQYCDGKIFYMGVIDVLQQYNIRKRLEARYHRMKGAGWLDASCVHPTLYADRFLRFFDEYTGAKTAAGGSYEPVGTNEVGNYTYNDQNNINNEGCMITDEDIDNVEEVVFTRF